MYDVNKGYEYVFISLIVVFMWTRLLKAFELTLNEFRKHPHFRLNRLSKSYCKLIQKINPVLAKTLNSFQKL